MRISINFKILSMILAPVAFVLLGIAIFQSIMISEKDKTIEATYGQALSDFSSDHSSSADDLFEKNIDIVQLHKLINIEREKVGKPMLEYNEKIAESACLKADDMVKRNYWSHNTPDGDEPWVFFQRAGVQYSKAGENLAYGFVDPTAVVAGWMVSEKHKENILGDYTAEGLCARKAFEFNGSSKQIVVVQHFAKQ